MPCREKGSPDTEVVFVGEGPGFNEDRLGRPFVGRAGDLLVEAARLHRLAARRGLHHQRREVPATGQPRPGAGRDRRLRAVPAAPARDPRSGPGRDPRPALDGPLHARRPDLAGPRHPPTGRPGDRRARRPGVRHVPSRRRAADAGHRADELRRRRRRPAALLDARAGAPSARPQPEPPAAVEPAARAEPRRRRPAPDRPKASCDAGESAGAVAAEPSAVAVADGDDPTDQLDLF